MNLLDFVTTISLGARRTIAYIVTSILNFIISYNLAQTVRRLPGGAEPDRWHEGVTRYTATFPEIVVAIIAVVFLALGIIFAALSVFRIANYNEYRH